MEAGSNLRREGKEKNSGYVDNFFINISYLDLALYQSFVEFVGIKLYTG